jgi:hypothetical protein
MIRRQTSFNGCGCGGPSLAPPAAGAGLGGFFELALNAAGSVVGDPALGSQIASQAGPAWARIKETPPEIAAHVAPSVKTYLTNGGALPDPAGISPQAQQIAAGVAGDVARSLAAEGVYFPPGTVGAQIQNPTYLNAFGGQNSQWVLVGGLALGALVLLKGL